ncbi:MAG: RNA polymerase sigma factor [Acidimicrobiales bacterium]|nr:RNA polymerase sigma factor [Acidimicrobiales bacterium]
MSGRRSDEELVTAARAGSAAAFDELYRAHAARLARRVRARCGRDEHVVADIVQEAFLRALENLDRLRDPARFWAWIGVIADHVIVDHHRVAARSRPLDDETSDDLASGDAPPCSVVEARDTARLVRRAVAGLSARDAEAIALVSTFGLSPAELGRVVGISSGAAKVRVHRARTRLRAAMLTQLTVARPDRDGANPTGAVATVTALPRVQTGGSRRATRRVTGLVDATSAHTA